MRRGTRPTRLLTQEAVLAGEDAEEFELYWEGMLQEMNQPAAVEAMLAERAVGLGRRLRRVEKPQDATFAALHEGEPRERLEDQPGEWEQIKGSS